MLGHAVGGYTERWERRARVLLLEGRWAPVGLRDNLGRDIF